MPLVKVALVAPAGELGRSIRDWLQAQSICFIAWDGSDGSIPKADFNEHYDIGFNFLGDKRIPAEQIGDGRRWTNWHPAPLPEYGGRNVAYHAIMEGAKEFGATVHYMAESFDTGDIIECIRFPIHAYSTAGSLMKYAKQNLVEMFMNWVPQLLKVAAGEMSPSMIPTVSQEGTTKYYRQQRIDDYIRLFPDQQRELRALTCPPHSAKIMIAGKNYKIIPEDE